MNIEIKNILDNDDKLYNRVRAYGPGDGINRWCVVVEDQDSIDLYGLRETGQSFPAAVDVDDLRTRAEAYLEDVSTPTQEVVFTYYFDTGIVADDVYYNGQLLTSGGKPVKAWTSGNDLGIKRGDTLRVVSKSLGQAFTGTVEELDWSPGEVEVRLGQPAYNLLDVINGPEKDEEREETALGLPAPIGVRAFRAQPGVSLTLNPYSNSRAIGVEVYISSDADDLVAPSRAYLARKSPGTRFDFPELESGAMWYFRVRSYDAKGDVSDWADVVSAIGGYIDGGKIEPGTIDVTPIADAVKGIRIVTTLPDTDFTDAYEIGDMVSLYEGGPGSDPQLYVLASMTGDPNTDWKKAVNTDDLEGYIRAANIEAGSIHGDKIIGNTIDTAQLAAGAVKADQISANAITADKIAAREITTSKLRSGHVEISDTGGYTGQPNAVRVYDDLFVAPGETMDDKEVVRMGYIGDKVSGADWGFWGALGTGVFIEGVPRILGVSPVSIVAEWDSSGVPAGSSVIFNRSSSEVAFSVEPGREAYAIPIVAEEATSFQWAITSANRLIRKRSSGSSSMTEQGHGVPFTAGDWVVECRLEYRLTAITAAEGGQANITVILLIIDRDVS